MDAGGTDVDLDTSGHGEVLVPSHLRSPIPCQRFIDFLWQLPVMSDKCIDDGLAVLAGNTDCPSKNPSNRRVGSDQKLGK